MGHAPSARLATISALFLWLGCILPASVYDAATLRLLGLGNNTQIDLALDDVVAHMLRTSPTFLAQCRRLGQTPRFASPSSRR
jgi:hypothetical protein